MWILDPSWRNLAAGHDLAIRLEAALRDRWSAPIEQAERRALTRATDAWSAARAADQRRWADEVAACERRNANARLRFAEQRAAWQQRQATAQQRSDAAKAAWQVRETARRRAFGEQYGAWAAEHALCTKQLRRRASIALTCWFAVTLTGLLLEPLTAAHIATGGLAALVAGLAMLLPAQGFLRHRARRPTYPTDDPEPVMVDEPEPVYEGDSLAPPRPGPVAAPTLRKSDVPLEVMSSWWREIHGDRRGSGQAYAHGDEGVARLIDALSRTLSHDHLTARDLLVRDKLDADVLVVGPSGVWVLEVKHWSGRIVCQRGDWWRERTYFAPGGLKETETKPLRPFDRQWQREVEAVTQTLSRRLTFPAVGAAAVRGGLVFSHPDALLDLDGSCTAAYGPPEWWADQIASQPPLQGFGVPEELRVLDALFAWSRKLETGASSDCAERLATKLHEQMSASASGYVQQLDAT